MPVRGGSKGRKRSSLNDLTQARLAGKNAEKTLSELAQSSDRAAAILGAASAQSTLRLLIVEYLARRDDETMAMLVERDGPLSTFFSTIRLGYALGGINKRLVADFDTVRRIRNVFAHSVLPIDFTHRQISKEIKKFYCFENDNGLAAVSGPMTANKSTEERTAFILTIQYLIVQTTQKKIHIMEDSLAKIERTMKHYRSDKPILDKDAADIDK